MTGRLTVGRLCGFASEVLSYLQIHDVRIYRTECRGAHPVADGPFQVNWSAQVRAEQPDGDVDCFSRYDITARGAAGVQAWTVVLEVVGVWRMTAGSIPAFDDDHLTSFALAIGVPALHPYAREAVQSAVSRLGYPPFTLEMVSSVANGDPDDAIDLTGGTE